MGLRDTLELMLQRGQDSPLLRYSLGGECLKAGDALAAVTHLSEAVAQNPAYSAAWKLLGQALAAAGSPSRARDAYREGIRVAEAGGDLQAAREMGVFLKRLERSEVPG
ncbi:MAG: tetratricopeptide repeat protein [Steroidobacteraceae bacterium]|jgi:predicted Zn-dependent protease